MRLTIALLSLLVAVSTQSSSLKTDLEKLGKEFEKAIKKLLEEAKERGKNEFNETDFRPVTGRPSRPHPSGNLTDIDSVTVKTVAFPHNEFVNHTARRFVGDSRNASQTTTVKPKSLIESFFERLRGNNSTRVARSASVESDESEEETTTKAALVTRHVRGTGRPHGHGGRHGGNRTRVARSAEESAESDEGTTTQSAHVTRHVRERHPLGGRHANRTRAARSASESDESKKSEEDSSASSEEKSTKAPKHGRKTHKPKHTKKPKGHHTKGPRGHSGRPGHHGSSPPPPHPTHGPHPTDHTHPSGSPPSGRPHPTDHTHPAPSGSPAPSGPTGSPGPAEGTSTAPSEVSTDSAEVTEEPEIEETTVE